MSKYRDRGAYHFDLFKIKGDPYREHVLDVVAKVRRFASPLGFSVVLDVGCGEGLIATQLTQAGFRVVGVEPDPWARELAAKHGFRVQHISFESVPQGLSFEAVLFLDVLEHVGHPKRYIEMAKGMTKKLFIAVPDREDPHGDWTFEPDEMRKLALGDGWEEGHFETRHARHFFVFYKP